VISNSFSLNQAGMVMEDAPNLEAGNRLGVRLDLQYGQATETVQGNATNELRPQVYRPIWPLTDKVTLLYHLMNGVQQSEDFNRFKSQHLALVITPSQKVSWQFNYYVGREQRDVEPQLNPTFPSLPTQPGLPIKAIEPAPKGRFHILDSYVTWNATAKLTLTLEADYVVGRVQDFSPPSRVAGGVFYTRYQFTPKFALAGRGEYLSDRGGLFRGVTQALKETTLTADFRVADGFVVRGEWRRDFSNQPFFLTAVPGVGKKEQNTLTLGLLWWTGRKEGTW
jgi:hypothetical protein